MRNFKIDTGDNVIFEEFNSISSLLETLEKRPNSPFMKGEDSSDSSSYEFTRTNSYNDAKDLLKYGFPDILPEIKEGVRASTLKAQEELTPKRRVVNSPTGFTPHIPNAILGLPDSMIDMPNNNEKIRTLKLIYSIGDNCRVEAQEFIKAGICLLSTINLFELKGIRTQLDVAFMSSCAGEEIVCPTLNLKKYGENFNLKKICFPLAHPSMFRRIGFKYLETCPGITTHAFASGYGRPIKKEEFKKINEQLGNGVSLNMRVISDEMENNPIKLLDYILKEIKK